MKDALDILMEARPYIDKGWCQHQEAVTVNDLSVDATSREAAFWCPVGALIRVSGEEDDPAFSGAMVFLARAAAVGGAFEVMPWNDDPDRTKEEVLDAFDRAIALALDEAES